MEDSWTTLSHSLAVKLNTQREKKREKVQNKNSNDKYRCKKRKKRNFGQHFVHSNMVPQRQWTSTENIINVNILNIHIKDPKELQSMLETSNLEWQINVT